MFSMAWFPAPVQTAIGTTLEEWGKDGRSFHLLAFLGEKDAAFVPVLQEMCADRHLTLAGALFPRLLADGQCCESGVLLLRLEGCPAPLLLDNVGSHDQVDTTACALAGYVEMNLPADREASVFCIFDALVPNIATHLDAWYLCLADRVRYFGVNAGSETFAPMPCLFDNRRVVSSGVLLQLLPDHPGACLNHDYGVPDTHLTATSAENNRIVQIDWQPPLDIYRELMQRCYGVEITQENFYEHAVHFPFGILRADGEVLVRIPVALGDDGSIACVGEIPPNSVLTLLDARTGVHRAPLQLANDLEALATSVRGEDLLLFYCAGRRMHMGGEIGSELGKVAEATGARHVYGALSLGEIGGARSGGYPLFHNATLVGVPCR